MPGFVLLIFHCLRSLPLNLSKNDVDIIVNNSVENNVTMRIL